VAASQQESELRQLVLGNMQLARQLAGYKPAALRTIAEACARGDGLIAANSTGAAEVGADAAGAAAAAGRGTPGSAAPARGGAGCSTDARGRAPQMPAALLAAAGLLGPGISSNATHPSQLAGRQAPAASAAAANRAANGTAANGTGGGANRCGGGAGGGAACNGRTDGGADAAPGRQPSKRTGPPHSALEPDSKRVAKTKQ